MDLEKISNIFGQDTIKKIYEDGASQPVQEGSKILIDFIKAARLFTAPIQLLAAYQDRLTNYLKKVTEGVPEKNQIQAPASLSGPIIERLKYLEEGNYLTELYLNLLSRAIDKERVKEAHPAFFHIIDQLSPDEAMILQILKSGKIFYDFLNDLHIDQNKKYTIGDETIKRDTRQTEKLAIPEYFQMYTSHLQSLDLASWKIVDETAVRDENGNQTGIYAKTEITLTEFGELFVKACIPEGGFIIYKNNTRSAI